MNEIFALLEFTQHKLVVADVSEQTIGPIFKGQADKPLGFATCRVMCLLQCVI
jgi:hypothetical protein